jgi:hypothetical protein
VHSSFAIASERLMQNVELLGHESTSTKTTMSHTGIKT